SSLGSGRAEDDVLQAWVCGKEILTAHMAVQMMHARDNALGPRHLRTREKPKLNEKGEKTGGVAFERCEHAKALNDTRCHTLAFSYEGPKKLVAPAAPGKMRGPELNATQVMRRDLLTAVVPIAMAAMNETVPSVYKALKSHAELANTPRMGTDDNFAYATAQLNIAPAQRAGG
ncbi:hypothetical protein DXG01_015067, partial [Tephrocybe rancida]